MPATQKPIYLRALGAKGLKEGKVDRENRKINGFSVMTVGEALGHNRFVDEETIAQVVELGNSNPRGSKSRFSHPGLSGDGLGRGLGRAKNFRLSDDGKRALADLHFSKSSSSTPSGDLAGHVMDLAEEDPESFGASIVLFEDVNAMREFQEAHTGEDNLFASPHPDNPKNLPHWRLSALRAVDVVDDPAANPGGFLNDGQELASKAESALSFIFEVSETDPGPMALGVDATRAKGFVDGFLARHGLLVVGESTLSQIKELQSQVTGQESELSELRSQLAAADKAEKEDLVLRCREHNASTGADPEVEERIGWIEEIWGSNRKLARQMAGQVLKIEARADGVPVPRRDPQIDKRKDQAETQAKVFREMGLSAKVVDETKVEVTNKDGETRLIEY